MTSPPTRPADQPPPDPQRGDPARLRWVRTLGATGVILVFAAAVLSRHNWVASVVVGAAAFVSGAVALLVLAWKGKRS